MAVPRGERSRFRREAPRGTISIQLLVVLVPVLFGMMGFAVDLGRLYLIKGELKAAANAMALAAAQRLIGNDAATGEATAAARLTLENSSGFGNKYDFGGILIGDTSGILQSEVPDPTYFEALTSALGQEGADAGSGEVGGASARYARVTLRADAPLLFWGLLSLGNERKTPIEMVAVAGVSAPLCTACAIDPIAIAALDASDETDFGFVANTKYTFGFRCTGSPTPSTIQGAGQRLEYLLINRFNEEAQLFPEENQQLYRIGAQGLLPSTTPAQACVTLAAEELMWVNAQPRACNPLQISSLVTSYLCGVATRFDVTVATGCENIPEVDTMASAYTPDIDISDLEDYAAYTGVGRRVITVPIVDTLSATAPMVVLGFRQFLVDPDPNGVNINPADQNGRFVGLYLGSVMPLKQGRFDGCQVASGPGKVVLHQ